VTADALERIASPPMSVPPLLVASIDIECFSESGDFPRAEKAEDFISIIGVHMSRAHEPLAPPRLVMFVAKACDAIDGCEVRASANEKEMLRDFVSFMRHEHPEVYVTYNGLNFDWGYIYRRVVDQHRLDLKDLGAYRSPRKLALVEKDKKDGRKLSFFAISGSLNLDVMIPIGDDYKLSSYKLDDVAEHFLGLRKVDLSPADIFQKTRPGASSVEVAEVVSYCVRDVELPLKLMHKLSILLNKLSDSEIVNTTLNDLVTRGQGIKIFSYVAGLCWQHDKMLIDDRVMRYNYMGGEKYEGAFVQAPSLADDNSVFHCDWPIVALDSKASSVRDEQ
jgi:DNA polymerase delta subunit 1